MMLKLIGTLSVSPRSYSGMFEMFHIFSPSKAFFFSITTSLCPHGKGLEKATCS